MKIVFIGTSELALPALKELLEHGHEILAVVTQPDRVSGRGKSIHFSPVKEEALRQGLLVLQPERIGTEEFQTQMQKLMPDLFVVASYGQKIPSKLMDVAPFGRINIHPSLLPKYRGALPLAGPILNGDEKTGVTIMRLSDQLDESIDLCHQLLIPGFYRGVHRGFHPFIKVSIPEDRPVEITFGFSGADPEVFHHMADVFFFKHMLQLGYRGVLAGSGAFLPESSRPGDAACVQGINLCIL